MGANSFGQHFVMTTFGESHGTALGVVVDGCPAGVVFQYDLLTQNLDRRRPGTNEHVSQRQEQDHVEILSGVFEGKTIGTPIAMLVRNTDARSFDYEEIKKSHRIGHADDTWLDKFGHVDHRGGGRSSGRETVARVMAGSLAQMYLKQKYKNLELFGYAAQIGSVVLTEDDRKQLLAVNPEDYPARFPSSRAGEVDLLLRKAREQGESYGGTAEVLIRHVPRGLGQPVFHKLKADFAAAMMGLGATCGFELGFASEALQKPGTQFHQSAQSQSYAGIRGGISTGEDILMRVHFKPTSSIMDVAKRGRHDPCIVTRAIPVMEAMAYLVLADHDLLMRTDRVD